MIPKVIHYCWFGGNPLPPLAQKCIASWKRFLPDYEIKEWNETNFDVNTIPYTQDAYAAKKYAFVSDYARFWILYHYGGIYFDTDVEVIKSLDKIIKEGPFMGCEVNGGKNEISVAPGLGLGALPEMDIYQQLLSYYAQLHFFINGHNETVVEHTTKVLLHNGLQNIDRVQKIKNIVIYTAEYFNPINMVTRRLHITNETCSIHHYAASWKRKESWFKRTVRKLVPEKILLIWNMVKRNLSI